MAGKRDWNSDAGMIRRAGGGWPDEGGKRPRRRRTRKNRGLTILLILILAAAIAMIGAGVYLIWFKNADAFQRQSTEENIADEYVNDLILKLRDPDAYAAKMAEEESVAEASAAEEARELWYRDADGGYWFVDADGMFWYGTESGDWVMADSETAPGETVPSDIPADGSDPEGTDPDAAAAALPDGTTGFFYRDSAGNWFFLADTDQWEKTQAPAGLAADSEQIAAKIRIRRLRSRFSLGTDEKEAEDLNYTDDAYYSRDGIVYTPDYAQGVIDCVLEVPSVKIRRGVYTGTWEQIDYDLNIWMVTAARPDYVLGQTHYCIYGHNHTVQNLSFNRLQKVQVGEKFYLTSDTGRYVYNITNVFAVSREDATSDYVNNFNLGSDKCYLITCGRDDGVRNFRYLDLIVEGTLEKHMTLEEYAASIGK